MLEEGGVQSKWVHYSSNLLKIELTDTMRNLFHFKGKIIILDPTRLLTDTKL